MELINQFSKVAQYYNDIYFKEDIYKAESVFLLKVIEKNKKSSGKNLLDVACGTGTHIQFFSKEYVVFGLDYSPEMLEIAKKCYPDIKFFHANMVDFKLDIAFDVILCLYGSVGLVQTINNLNRTLKTFSEHLNLGGVLILVPWSNKEDFKEKIVSDIVKKPEIKIVRMENVQRKNETQVEITYHYLIGKDREIKHFTGEYYIGLFSQREYQEAIQNSGLKIKDIYQGEKVQMGTAYICSK